MIAAEIKRATSLPCLAGAVMLFATLATADLLRAETGVTKSVLKHVDTLRRPDLRGVNSGTISKDGKYLYTSSWMHDSVNVFHREPETGHLTHVQTLTSERDLQGVTSIRLSLDGRYAVAAAFQSRTVVLLRVDPETGRLRIADVVRNDENGVRGLTFAIAAEFSADSKFVYAADPTSSGLQGNAAGAVTVFRVSDNAKLRWIECNVGEDGCFHGGRWNTLHPDRSLVFTTCATANTLVISRRDEESGRLEVARVFRDEEDAFGLEGAMTSALSPDGNFLYVSSGRFSGDSAIGVYAIEQGGDARLVQEVFAGVDGMKNFLGGNAIKVSPDGRHVYAAGTRSQSFVRLERNQDTGELRYLETISDGSAKVGVVTGSTWGAAGIAISPDSRFVYVMVESAGMIEIYRVVNGTDTP